MSRLQASRERCATAHLGAHHHIPTMGLGDFPHDKQPQPDTAHLAVLAGASSHWLEQHAHQRVSNHRPMVMDREAGPVVVQSRGNGDRVLQVAIGHAIGHQVADDLLQAVAIQAGIASPDGAMHQGGAGESHPQLSHRAPGHVVQVQGAGAYADANANPSLGEVQ